MSKTLHSTLESNIRVMNEALADLGHQLAETDSSNSATDLTAIIHRPGWTTIAEEMLVESLVAVVTQHAQVLTQAHKSLIDGALAVGK
jgi:hypothetical protein